MKTFYYTIAIRNKTTVHVTYGNYDITNTNYITGASGDKIEFENGCWYLWNENTLITSGLISGLRVKKVRKNVKVLHETVDFIDYIYTAYDEITV